MRSCERFGFLSFICIAFLLFFFLGRVFVQNVWGVGGFIQYIHMDLSGDNLHFACC